VGRQVWENETKKPFTDFAPSSGGVLDRPHWSDRDGEPRSAPVDDMPTPAGDGWRWVNDSWSVDSYPPTTSRDGWQYAGSFAAKALAWSSAPAPLRFVRRRRHVRLQQLGGSGGDVHPLRMMREFIARSRGAGAAMFGVVPAYLTAGAVERASWGTARLSAAQLPSPPAARLPEPELEPQPEPQPEAEPKPEPDPELEPEPEPEPEAEPATQSESAPQSLGQPPSMTAPSPASVLVEVHDGGAGFVCDDQLIVTKVQRGKASEAAGLQPGMQLHSFQGTQVKGLATGAVSGTAVDWASVKQLVQTTPKPWCFSFGPAVPETAAPAAVPTPTSPPAVSEPPAPALSALQILQRHDSSHMSGARPPEGVCIKQKPTMRTWPTRYIRLEGKSLNVFQNKGDMKPRGSSIPDVTGCDITTGVETWALQGTWHKMVVSRADLKPPVGPVAAFCFRTPAERDRFVAALRNVAQGRVWDDDGSSESSSEVASAPGPPTDGVTTTVDARNSMLTPEPQPAPAASRPSMAPIGEQRSSIADNLDLLLSQHMLPDALATAHRDLGPAISRIYPEISDVSASEAALDSWVAVLDHLSQPWASDESKGRVLRELGFRRTGHQLREALGISTADHEAVMRDRLTARRRAALRALFARDSKASIVDSMLGPRVAECTVELLECQLPSQTDGSIIVRIEASVGDSGFSLSNMESTSWLSAPAYAKRGHAKWYTRGGKFSVAGAVSSLRIFVETATSDGRSITANRRGMVEVAIVTTDPLGVEPVTLTTQSVAGLENAGNEVDVHITKADGAQACYAGSVEPWKQALYRLGVRSIALQDNPNAIMYKHRIEVECYFDRQMVLVFTDGTGETYVLRCLTGGKKTLAFNSTDPTIQRVATCEMGLQGMKATAATLTTVRSDELTSEAEWFPGKNLLKLAKGASGILGPDEIPGAMAFEGGKLTVNIRQWERDTEPEHVRMQLEFEEAKQAAQQYIKAGNREAATAQLEVAEKLKQELASSSDAVDDSTVAPSLENPADQLQLIVGRIIAWYVERGSQLGAGHDLSSDDDDREDEWVDGNSADNPDDNADEWVGLSTTVSDERVSGGYNPDGMQRGSTVFDLRKQMRGDAHTWPLSTIVPWRVFYLFEELAIDADASNSFLWLCQISGMLRTFPRVPGIVYMEALERLWAQAHLYFGADETAQAQALEQAVLSVTSHCILRSIRDLWQSYPQGNRSTADDHLDALQCGLRVLKLLTAQTVKVENEGMLSPDETRAECDRQLTSQLEDAISEAAQGVGLCLQGVRNVDYFAAPPDEESDDEEWEVVDDEHRTAAQADELRHKMRELVKNMGTVCEAIINFNNYYAQVFQAESDLPASATFTEPLYDEIWQTMRLVQKNARPQLHIEDVQNLIISCTRLNRSVAASCNLELNDVAEAVEPFVCAAIEHCGVQLNHIADAAIKMDDFKPMNATQLCSTSIVDLLRACVQSVQPLQYLIWSQSAAVKMTKRLGQVLVWYATLVGSSCKGDVSQLRVALAEQDGVALSSAQVAAAYEREGELLCRLFVHTNNMFHAHQQLANLGDKIDTLHHILQQEGPDGWSDHVQHTSKLQWDTNVESWSGKRSWEDADAQEEAAEEDDGARLEPTMSRLNRGEVTDPAAVVDIFLKQCQMKYRECVAEVVDAIGLNVHNKIVAGLADAAAESDCADQLLRWLDSEVLAKAEETLHQHVFRRFIRALHFQCFCQLETILLGDGLASSADNAAYIALIGRIQEMCTSITSFFGDQPLGAASAKLSARIQGLLSVHVEKSSEDLRVLCTENDPTLPEHISLDDLRRILAARSKHDAVALGVLQEQGLSSSSVQPPEGFNLGLDETVLGRFECWFPAGSVYVCTDHLLFEPKLASSEETKLQVRYSEIRFVKKQKMTGIGTDTCLEIGLDEGQILCFRGFMTANASGQSVRDNCHALICQQSAVSCGNDLESAEAGSWPELRRMFGIPANETLIETFSCHYVVHGVDETTHTNEGTLYVTRSFLCFHSYFFGLRRQEVIPLRDCARIEKSSYPLLVPNAIDVFTTASSDLSATKAMNRRTFFGFGFGLDRQAAYDTICEQLRLCRSRAAGGEGGGGAGDDSDAADAATLVYLVCVFSEGDRSIPLCCVLTGARGDSGERSLGPAAEKSYALECTDLGELISLRIWPADEARDDATAMAATYQRTMLDRVPARVPPRLSVERVVVQTRAVVGGVAVGSAAVFTSTAKRHRRGPLELTRESDEEAYRQAQSPSNRVLEVEEEVFENQRRPAFSLNPEFSAAELTPVERGPWTDEKGRPRCARNFLHAVIQTREKRPPSASPFSLSCPAAALPALPCTKLCG
jgi:hypothetical protein